VRQAVFGRDAPWFAVADARVVNHCVKWFQCIDLFGYVKRLSYARQVADHNRLRSGDRGHRFFPSPLVSRVQNCGVSLLDEELRSHSAETIRRTGNEHSRHNPTLCE
jgi:hypothetical protein